MFAVSKEKYRHHQKRQAVTRADVNLSASTLYLALIVCQQTSHNCENSSLFFLVLGTDSSLRSSLVRCAFTWD